MKSTSTDRRDVVEQQLFEVFSELERARVEVEYFQAELWQAQRRVSRANARMAQSETPLAQAGCHEARQRVATARDGVVGAMRHVDDLEDARDRLLSKLVG